MDLFQLGNFTLRSGAKSHWKIECDALSAILPLERRDQLADPVAFEVDAVREMCAGSVGG